MHNLDCNSVVECAEIEVGRKDLQLGAQAGSIGFYQFDIIKKNNSCGHSFRVEVNHINPCVDVWYLYVIT